jgi:hypothetical protein
MLNVILDQDYATADRWRVRASLTLDAGGIDALARAAHVLDVCNSCSCCCSKASCCDAAKGATPRADKASLVDDLATIRTDRRATPSRRNQQLRRCADGCAASSRAPAQTG